MKDKSQALAMSNDPRVRAALADYLARMDRGEPFDVAGLLKAHSVVASELQSLVEIDQQARRMAGGRPQDANVSKPNDPMPESPRSRAEVSTHSVVGAIDGTLGGKLKPLEPSAEISFVARSTGDLPDMFGRYRVLRKLGSGAMGAVYLADDTVLHRRVALKTPTFEDDTDGELLRRFYREARAVANLKHPNLCAVYDVGEIDGRHYISMEFVRGKKLQDYIRPDKPMTEKQAMAVVRKIALAMQVAHTHGVIHRDLKPDNIMVNEKGEPVVMDFGLVHKTESKNSTRITQRGMLIGSPAYMSKEQVEGDPEKLTAATDQYSLGVILYQLLTAKLPFEGGIHGVLAAILTKDPTPPGQLRSDVNPRLEAICLKMMAKDPKDRFPSMKDVSDAITKLARGTASDSKESVVSVAAVPASDDLNGSVVKPLVQPRDVHSPSATDAYASIKRPIRNGVMRGVRKPPSRHLYAGITAAALVLLLGIVFWIRSGDALIKVNVLSDDIEVLFQEDTFTINDGPKQLRVTPGEHLLHIKSDDVEFDTNSFALKRGENPTVTVAIVDADIVTKLGDQEIGRKVRLKETGGHAAAAPTDSATTIELAANANTSTATPYLTARIAELQQLARNTLSTELASGKSDDLKNAAKVLLTRCESVQESDEKLALVDLSRDLLAQAGDVEGALDLCRRMDQDFDIDAAVVKVRTLKRLAQVSDAGAKEAILVALLATGFEALASDNFVPGQDAVKVASTLAKIPDRHDYEYQTRYLSEELERAKSAYEQLPAEVRSADYVTTDAQQNSLRGQYECLIKNDWLKGTELLLAGTKTWMHLGEREESKPTTPADKISLGDLWWEAAGESPPTMGESARRRARYWYLSALSQLTPEECAEAAKRLTPRIDQVPRTPIILRVRMTGLSGYHGLRITNDGVQTTWRGHRKTTGDIHVNHLRWKDNVAGHRNFGTSRLLPAGIDFSTTRLVNKWHSRWGAINVTKAPDFVELTFWHCPGNETSSFDLTLELESDGFDLPSRFTQNWEVNYFAWPQKDPPADVTARDAFFNGEPIDKLKMSSINFISEASPLDAWRPGAPPTKKVGAENFALAAISDWELPAGRYQAVIYADDGIRVLIDDKVVLDNWIPPNSNWWAASEEVRLPAGPHKIRVEYWQAGGTGILQFGLKRLGD